MTNGGISRPLKVAIIGAGPGGAVLAAGLQQYDHLDVHIFETKPKLGDIGASVTLSRNAVAALRSISPILDGVLDKVLTNLRPDQDPTAGSRMFAGCGKRAGELLGWVKFAKFGFAQYNVHRSDFLNELGKELRATKIRLGARVLGYTQTESEVHISLAHGSTESFDVVFGADGLRSVVRASMYKSSPESEPTFTGAIAWRAFVDIAEAKEALGEDRVLNASFTVGPGLVLLGQPADRGRKFNMVVCSTGNQEWPHERWSVPADNEELKYLLQDWGTYGAKWAELMDKPGVTKWSVWQSAMLPHYNDGCVAIVGDSCHAMTPFAGNGAAQSFEDAAVLTAIFGKVQRKDLVPHALAAYDLARRARAQRVVTEGRRSQDVTGFQEPGTTFDNVVQRLCGTQDWVVNRDIPHQNQHAVQIFEEMSNSGSRFED